MSYVMLLWGFLIAVIWVLMIGISSLFSVSVKNVKSNSSFECGMEPILENRPPFYMNFYMVAILFLIFDMELVISIPLVFSSMNYNLWLGFWFMFMIILLWGLIVEINYGSLDWKECV